MTANSLRKRRSKAKPLKPEKPYDGFPLTPHASGKWCKKVRGRLHYFGSWDDPIAALNEWLAVRDQLMAGVDPKANSGAADVALMVNTFLDAKEQQRNDGDLTQKSFDDYRRACERLASFFGKGRMLDSIQVADFQRYRQAFPSSWGSVRINNEIAL